MCIRDSSSISVGGALQGKMSGINILSSSGFPGAETSISIRGVGTFGNGDASPVSYTHLDVYKRQVDGSICFLVPSIRAAGSCRVPSR